MLRAQQAGTPPDLTKASDVWQLGVLFSRIFTGSWPYPTNNWHEFERFALRGPAAVAVAPGVRALPAPVGGLIPACLDPRPEARPPVAEVLDRLGGLGAGSPAAPAQPAPVQPVPAPPTQVPRRRAGSARGATLLASRPRTAQPAAPRRPVPARPAPARPASARPAQAPARSRGIHPVRAVRAVLGFVWRFMRNVIILLFLLAVGLVAAMIALDIDPEVLYHLG